MTDTFLKPPGMPSAPGVAPVPPAKSYGPRGLLGGAVRTTGADMSPPDRGRDRAQRLIAESKARREAHRQDVMARHDAMPKGLLR